MTIVLRRFCLLSLQTLITAVAQVGVDLNAMAANTWRQAPLQFVPGLGPRKARALLAAIAANDNHVKTRVDLLRPNVSAWHGFSCV
jgi:transcription elongation factor SPT6